MAIYRGLNLNFNLADVDDKDAALEGIGLNIGDLDVIRGLDNAGVNAEKLQTIAGLDLDQKKELYAISRSSATIGNLVRSLKDIQVPLDFNMRIDDQVRAGAIKYNYIDWDNPAGTPKSADISTSRVSSWSSTDSPASSTSPIFYGGQVKVIGNDVTADSIEMNEAPILARYPAEQPTHVINIDVNGVTKEVHAMKGIPLTFSGFFKNASIQGKTDGTKGIPTWTIKNEDDNRFYETYTPDDENNPRAGGSHVVGTDGVWNFYDSRPHPRTLSFYYNPNNITEFSLTNLNLTELPNVSLPAITKYNISYNDFYELPNFEAIAPNLTDIIVDNNNLSRTGVPANTQLQRFSTTLRSMQFRGCFTDSTQIDLRKYTSLVNLDFASYYSSYGARHMTGSMTSPYINSSTIVNYRCDHQYAVNRLDKGVCEAPNLVTLDIDGCNITDALGPGEADGDRVDLFINSSVFTHFYSYSNNHNIVKVNASPGPRDSIKYYRQTHCSPWGGLSEDSQARTINGKFNNCGALGQINLYATGCQGDVGTAFQNLNALDYLEIRWTNIGGKLSENAFSGTDNLRWLLMAGSSYNDSNFFDATFNPDGSLQERGQVFANLYNLQHFFLYNNKNVAGPLPDFSENRQLRRVYIVNTSLDGSVTAFNNNTKMWGVYLINNNFTGSVPAFRTDNFYHIYLYGNQFSGQMPEQASTQMRNFRVQYNNITGSIPSFELCPRLQYAYFYNNQITGYDLNTMHKNTWLRRLDLSNNRLSAGSMQNVIFDMLENYARNPRSGVVVNMIGQTTASGTAVTENDVAADETTAEALQTLRSVGWTILI